MKLVLLSGGSGKRLWPLSNDARSKQFLKVLENDFGEKESMVQRVWGQLSAAGLTSSTVIATSKAQVDMISSQLGKHSGVVVEPERRDTFPAIALAASYLYSEMMADPNEVMAVLPVDPYVETAFFHKIKELEQVIHESHANIALLGVKPTYPSEKYGYIVPDNGEHETWMNVASFTEKPSTQQAEKLMNNNALWNCGVFAFRLGYILSLLAKKGFPMQYSELLPRYSELPDISFDYEVVEKEEHVVAVMYKGYWKDLGTWNTLTDEMKGNKLGAGMLSDDCVNTHLINELDIPVTVIGASNLVIAASPDGILVSDKEKSHYVKTLAKDLGHRPMYEERRWGWYKVLDFLKVEKDAEVLTKRIGVTAGQNLSYQTHDYRSEVWTIIKGIGEFALNDEIFQVKPGDVLQIPAGAKHGIRAITDMEIIEVQTGSQLIEEDIVRIYMSWDEVERHCRGKKPAVSL
ncbi:sugar phosphate nucleotidyltransferase [Fictibacillus aquaticus]|uniref:Mannose-1-phosphate guanylyltransferase n=1 Tax=Fictibacillus aquaticus TaxID=2021314 RepID=A0A235F8T1_9BACL|nr:sugar phosphate nucleotidyltransferase [Fictibacillus aquaticus]OYD57716.1 mannose-1-phosphate guanylyltransferase [Fictibacillus aquaticus]